MRSSDNGTVTKIALPDDAFVLESMMRICEKACKMEEDRYESLLSLSSRVFTSISLLAVAVITAIGHVAQYTDLSKVSWPYFAATIVLLSLSFLAALISQWRGRYDVIDAPLMAVINDFNVFVDDDSVIDSRAKATVYFIKGLSDYHESIAVRNDRLRIILRLSLILLTASVVAALSGFILVQCQ